MLLVHLVKGGDSRLGRLRSWTELQSNRVQLPENREGPSMWCQWSKGAAPISRFWPVIGWSARKVRGLFSEAFPGGA